MGPENTNQSSQDDSTAVVGEMPAVVTSPEPTPLPVEEKPAPVATKASPAAPAAEVAALAPMPVVQVLSPRGVEYVFLTINLFAAAMGLIGTLLAFVNGKTDFDVLAFPVALLLVSLPLFAFFFLRLKKAELLDPALKQDPSKRRSTQLTQVVSYLTVFVALIALVSGIFASIAGKYSGSLLKLVLSVIVFVVVAGGILAYYWIDEHRGL
jgi:hypothetical protein